MRRMIFALAFWLLAAPALGAEETPQDATPRMTIEAQLEAFRADDWERAFSFAAPDIRAMFGDAKRFSQMVRRGYKIVWRHEKARFIEGAVEEDEAVQIVEFIDEEGRVWRVLYNLARFDGAWRITGVVARERPTQKI